MKKIIALIILAMLVLAGCNTGTKAHADKTPATTVGTNAPDVDVATLDTSNWPTEDPDAQDSSDTTASFGDSFTYDDGLIVKVSQPKQFKPSAYAMVEDAKMYVTFTITVVNGTGKLYDPGMFTASMQSGDKEATDVIDSGNGYELSPTTKVLPNRQSTWKIGYGVSGLTDLVLDVSPGFEYDDALFAN